MHSGIPEENASIAALCLRSCGRRSILTFVDLANFCTNSLRSQHIIDATRFYGADRHIRLFGGVWLLGDRDAPHFPDAA